MSGEARCLDCTLTTNPIAASAEHSIISMRPPQRTSQRLWTYSESFHCAFGLHTLIPQTHGLCLHRFVPGPGIKSFQYPSFPRPCVFAAAHPRYGKGIIMASHEWSLEDFLHIEVCYGSLLQPSVDGCCEGASMTPLTESFILTHQCRSWTTLTRKSRRPHSRQ